jgi:hypothetical protein
MRSASAASMASSICSASRGSSEGLEGVAMTRTMTRRRVRRNTRCRVAFSRLKPRNQSGREASKSRPYEERVITCDTGKRRGSAIGDVTAWNVR